MVAQPKVVALFRSRIEKGKDKGREIGNAKQAWSSRGANRAFLGMAWSVSPPSKANSQNWNCPYITMHFVYLGSSPLFLCLSACLPGRSSKEPQKRRPTTSSRSSLYCSRLLFPGHSSFKHELEAIAASGGFRSSRLSYIWRSTKYLWSSTPPSTHKPAATILRSASSAVCETWEPGIRRSGATC